MKTRKNNRSIKRPSPIAATLNVHSLGAQGDGLSQYNDKPVFIEQALMGETIEVSLFPEGQNAYRGAINHIIKASSDRVTPPCQHYSKCGGCRLQHMDMAAYQAWKTNTTRDYLTSKNIIPHQWDEGVFIPPQTRRRITFGCLKQKDTLIMGFHQRNSRMLFNLKQCELLTPSLQALLATLKTLLSSLLLDKQTVSVFLQQADNGIDVVLTGALGQKDEPDLQALEAITDFARSTNVLRVSWRQNEKLKVETVIELAKPVVQFGHLQVSLAPLAFLQPSKEGETALIDTIKSYLGGQSSGKAVDLFAGCGTFTGVLASQGFAVDAFEGDTTAIGQLKASGHKQAYTRDLFRDPLLPKELNEYDVAIIDPPRAGAKAQSEALAHVNVPVIIAVSCNPATFARDARILIDGGYTLERITIIDQFIWSAHVELVAVFRH